MQLAVPLDERGPPAGSIVPVKPSSRGLGINPKAEGKAVLIVVRVKVVDLDIVGYAEGISLVGLAEAIGGQKGALDDAIAPIPAGVQRVPVEGIVGQQALTQPIRYHR